MGIGILDAMVPSAIIDADTAELAKFSREVRGSFPPAVRGLVKASCQMIAQCCPTIRSQILSFSLSADRDGLMEQCFGKKDSPNYRANVGACPAIGMMMKMSQEPDVIKFLSIDKSKLVFGKTLGQTISDVCSADDVMSIVCEADKNNILPTCQRRVLENLAKMNTDRVYQEKIAYMKMKGKEYGTVIKQTFS
ncbi:unnamed protein product [Rotaria sp. Silwood2]|nr:unnamed protein product [Rotaria sp. Silwood2]CAF2520445.1 unnamed protein product [Rotaria sp. Silwood2]CAF2792466.1 unnamed protein product [Rotaria sp. Silwood2]CAF3949816.1 unnamed protein product [Rotaria sp. Silwood2]CAF3999030.1 unnamed protein product [Rotaria sp. Silwood2]